MHYVLVKWQHDYVLELYLVYMSGRVLENNMDQVKTWLYVSSPFPVLNLILTLFLEESPTFRGGLGLKFSLGALFEEAFYLFKQWT